ncbi:MAG: hypothetical protein M3Q45_10925 [Chloroflexota bacterium]|nr:hypothetical protein [Chloroflexota bacterium]
MKNLLIRCCLAFVLLGFAVPPVLAQTEISEPFCGDLSAADCALLRQSGDAMLNLTAYTTSVEYKLIAKGLPEIAEQESGVTLRIDSRYALNEVARQSLRFFAVQSREDPLAAVAAIGDAPALLIDLYAGMTADLNFTLDVSQDWAESLSDSEITWPATTHVAARLVGGVLYIDVHELKALIPELAETQDWVAIEVVKILEELAAKGTFKTLAADVAASSTGRSVWGLDPAMLNLITSMRAAFGRPKSLEPFMGIERGEDVTLADQKGAFYQIEFAALDFILSDEFRNLLMQSFEVAAASSGDEVDQAELAGIVDLFWLFAPSIFRDLEISGSYTIGLDDSYQHAGQTLIHWDLKTVLQAIGAFSGEELPDLGDESYIDFITETENAGFDEAVTVEAPANAEIIPSESLTDLEALGFAAFDSDGEGSNPDDVIVEPGNGPAWHGKERVQRQQANNAAQNAPPAIGDDASSSAADPACEASLDTAAPVFAEQNYAASIEALADVIDTACADSAYAHQLLGAAYYHDYEALYNSDDQEQADPDAVYRAITLFSGALELDHEYARAYYYRGLAFESFGSYGHAVDDLSQAIDLAPDDPYAYFLRARIYAEIGQTQPAIDDYRQFLELYEIDDEWRALAERRLAELE